MNIYMLTHMKTKQTTSIQWKWLFPSFFSDRAFSALDECTSVRLTIIHIKANKIIQCVFFLALDRLSVPWEKDETCVVCQIRETNDIAPLIDRIKDSAVCVCVCARMMRLILSAVTRQNFFHNISFFFSFFFLLYHHAQTFVIVFSIYVHVLLVLLLLLNQLYDIFIILSFYFEESCSTRVFRSSMMFKFFPRAVVAISIASFRKHITTFSSKFMFLCA